MKYRELKHLIDVILTGDMAVPDDDAFILAGLRYSLEVVAMNCEPARLSFSKEEVEAFVEPREVVRFDLNTDRTICRAKIPQNDDDEIDMDEGLCFPTARLVASLFSSEKGEYHRQLAMEELKMYTKGQESMRAMELNNENYGM